ncbi:hypothetical protein [Streptomyces sp. NPDC056045]|uniref:hypothetical protein n=1 Tax=Streptomyces sp. NPDC056045 TaxID=3345691 RepID=UPI0035DD6B3C
MADVDDAQELVLEDLPREQVLAYRVRGMKDHSVAFNHIDQHDETSARRLFSHQLVDEVQRLTAMHHLALGHVTWRAGMSGGETSGVGLARVALKAVCKNGAGRKVKKRPRAVTTVRRDGREPMGLGAAIGVLVTERA